MSIGLDALRAAIDLLLADESGGADQGESLQEVLGLETETRRLAAVQQRTIAALLHQLPGDGAAELGAVLASELRITRADAAARVRAAQNMGPRWGLTGEPLPTAIRSSRRSASRRTHLGGARGHDRESRRPAPRRGPPPNSTAPSSTYWWMPPCAPTRPNFAVSPPPWQPVSTRTAPNRPMKPHHRRRFLRLQRHRDGSSDLTGHLTPETTAVWVTLLDAASAPQPATDSNGERDLRTAIQRNHDGFLDLGLHVLRTGDQPSSGGIPVTILATATWPNSPPRQAARLRPATPPPPTATYSASPSCSG